MATATIEHVDHPRRQDTVKTKPRGQRLLVGGLTPDESDRGCSQEQNDSDDGEPHQALDGEADDRQDEPEYEQDDEEDEHDDLHVSRDHDPI
jgi:hypothetical protein